MISINKVQLQTLDSNFYDFAKRTINHKRPNVNYVISQLKKHETQYTTNGFYRDFLLRLEDFAIGAERFGSLDIAGITYSALAKFQTTPEMKEHFIKGGLRVAKKQGDFIHILARIADLKNLYRKEGNKNKLVKIFYQEEGVLTDILRNFGKTQKRYRSVSKKMAPEATYKFRLASVKLDIAKSLKPKDRVSRLLEAKEIFEELGYPKQVNLIDRMLYKSL